MTFKRHAMGPIEARPVAEKFEADFHQLLRPALVRCVNMGNKKREGYVMGAFREALANYRVKTPEQTARSVELTDEEAKTLLSIVSNIMVAAQNLEIQATTPSQAKEYRRQVDAMSALKVKFMVQVLMGVENDVPGV